MRLIEPQTLDVICERDLRATMDDGVVLLADRWVASDTAATAQPTVLVRSPYGRRQFVGLLLGRLLAERGFQVVVQSVRGTFGSGGEFDPFNERADGLATLAWLREQAWHDGAGGDDRSQLPRARPVGDRRAGGRRVGGDGDSGVGLAVLRRDLRGRVGVAGDGRVVAGAGRLPGAPAGAGRDQPRPASAAQGAVGHAAG